jgi:hypothetical protein
MSTSSKDSRPAFGTSGPTDRVAKRLRELGYIHSSEQREQRKAAGKKSALPRVKAGRARLSRIKKAYSLLEPEYKASPYSRNSLEALRGKYNRLWGDVPANDLTLEEILVAMSGCYLELPLPDEVGCETLKSGLRQLGVKGRRGQNGSV